MDNTAFGEKKRTITQHTLSIISYPETQRGKKRVTKNMIENERHMKMRSYDIL